MFYRIALIWPASPLGVKISDYIRICWTLSLLEMSHYCIFLLYHLIIRCSDGALTCMADDAHMPAFAFALYMWLVDGSPWLWTPPVIRSQMALQWLIIDAANMWQLLINIRAGWIVQTRTALMIHWKPRGERWEWARGREEEQRKIIP